MMNERIKELAEQAGISFVPNSRPISIMGLANELEEFAQLLKEAIYDEVMEELLDEVDVEEEKNPESRAYLRGCNGGLVDALCIIRNFGVDIEE